MLFNKLGNSVGFATIKVKGSYWSITGQKGRITLAEKLELLAHIRLLTFICYSDKRDTRMFEEEGYEKAVMLSMVALTPLFTSLHDLKNGDLVPQSEPEKILSTMAIDKMLSERELSSIYPK